MSFATTLMDMNFVLAGRVDVDVPLAEIVWIGPISDGVFVGLWFVSQVLSEHLGVISHQCKSAVAATQDFGQAAEIG